jgi:uncharacterized membrane protein (UPF0127 family)
MAAPTVHGRLHVDGLDVAAVEVAQSRRAVRRGLLGRDGVDGALLLTRAKQVHTVRMRFAIDVAFLARDGRVLQVRTMRPGRLSPLLLRARDVLEAEAGRFDAWGLAPGAHVEAVTSHP